MVFKISNSDLIKVHVSWRRRDSRLYAELPVNRGQEGRPWFLLQRILEVFFLKKWIEPWQVILYILNRDRAKMMREMRELNKLLELRDVKNGNRL